jgi:ABC-2 type transport system ATP-binding protein
MSERADGNGSAEPAGPGDPDNTEPAVPGNPDSTEPAVPGDRANTEPAVLGDRANAGVDTPVDAVVAADLTKHFVVRRRRGATAARRLLRDRVVVEAVAGVSFRVPRGSVVGYVGPNGAGKSTTVKMLTGILVPSSGEVRVAGLEPSKRRIDVARRIGVVFGQRSQLWWDLPLADSFALARHLYDVPEARHAERLEECVDLLEMGPFLATPVRQLSLGQRMRGELTIALLHDPEVLFLDEPTIGLDVVSKTKVRAFLADLNARHATTIMLTTHDLGDIERLCSRLLIIDHGRVIFDGGLDDLRRRYEPTRTLVVDLATAREPLQVEGATVTRVDGARQWLRFDRREASAAELVARVAAAAELADLTVVEPDIEDVVARIYRDGHVIAPDRTP